MTTVVTVNPATGRPIRRYPAHDETAVGGFLDHAHNVAAGWAGAGAERRTATLRRLAALLGARREEYARLITHEMGKPITQARAEVDRCARHVSVVADRTQDRPQGQAQDQARPDLRGDPTGVERVPFGVVLALTSWSDPFGDAVRLTAAALAAGNTVLLKQSGPVTGCSLALERVMAAAGLPGGAFRALVLAEGEAPDVVQRLIGDPRVAAVGLRGSESAASAIGRAAGAATKPTVLHRGRPRPFVVLDDADVTSAAETAARSRFANAGQGAEGAWRFVVHERVADEFAEQVAKSAAALVIGDPGEESTTLGPLAGAARRATTHEQVTGSVALGARLVTGGEPAGDAGYYYCPTVLDGVTPGMPVSADRTRGPVLAILRFRQEEEALALADCAPTGGPSGTEASVWGDPDRALAVGRELAVGRLSVNGTAEDDPWSADGGLQAFTYARTVTVHRPA